MHEVQRRVINDFAAQVQSTLQTPQNEPFNTWERESVDSLETSNKFFSQQATIAPKVTGPIVRSNHPLTLSSKQSQISTNTISMNEGKTNTEIQEQLRRSYHESFFVKNTPVTGDEQVSAWLGVNRVQIEKSRKPDLVEKASSVDDNESESNTKRKSILKRSPSVDSQSNSAKHMTAKAAGRQGTVPQSRTANNKVRVKDSLEVINTKLLKDLETQVNGFS